MDYKNYQSKSNRKNKRATIDLVNVVYDEEFVSLINSLSKVIKNYYTLTLNIIRDLYNNSLVIDNNSIYSKCLINEINYNTKEKIKQLEEKIETISNTKKIFEKNILLVHSNLNKFFNDSKQIFQNLKNIRNSKINYAIELNKRYEHVSNNSMINFKTSFEKNDSLIDQIDNERYHKKFNNSLSNEKPLSSLSYKRNRLFHLKGNSTEINKRHKLKSIYFNNNLTNNCPIINNNHSFKIKNKLIDDFPKKINSYENTTNYKQNDKKIKIGNLNNILEFTPEIAKNKSSYNNFYINQNSNINLNSNDINNINNNNLELSYKVIEFLSLLSNISKNNAKNNPNIRKMIQNFEKTKKNLFELSKKFIEQNNINESKLYSRKSSSNSTNEKEKKNNISKKEMQLILMNNNIENIRKGIEYKELIDKIKYLSNNINKLEKQNKQLSYINNNTKKELMNNTLLLSKKNSQLNLINKEKSQYISQINVLQKDNEALMELIKEKNNKDIKNGENTNIKELNIIKQKEKTINELNKKINEFDKILIEKNNESNILSNKIKELNESLDFYKNEIQKKDNIIQQIKIDNNNKNNTIINKQNVKNQFNNSDLIFEKSEEFLFIPDNNFHQILLNIEQIDSFNFLFIKPKKTEKNINKEEIEKLENKISELNSLVETKENEIKKYKNENSILKSFAKISKKNNEEDDDENNNQKLEEEINKLRKEKEIISEEKNNLEINFKKLLSDNKNIELKLDSKNTEVKNLENNVKELEDQIKEIQMKNIEKIYNEPNSSDKIEEEKESRNTKRNNLLEADTDKNNEIIAQLKEELKEKENEIEYLKIELQELKSKMEENEDNYFDSSLKNSDINDKNDKYNIALEEKIKFLTERNEYYQKLYDEDKLKLQNLENLNNKLKNEIEELKNKKINENNEENEENDSIKVVENIIEEKKEKNEKKYSLKNYSIISDTIYGEFKWYLLINKSDPSITEKKGNYNYDNLLWVPKINIIDIDNYNEVKNDNNEIKKEDNAEKKSNKIYKNEIHINREKEISFSNISFNNNSDELNKNKQNSNNNSSSIKRGSFFSLGNMNIINDENNANDYNKLLEKYKTVLEKMNKTEENNIILQKKYSELKEKVKKINKNNNNQKISISDDSNNFSNANDVGKLSIVDNNFTGEGDIIGKLNNKNEREQEYYESLYIELEATKNQLKVVKEIFKELEKKFDTVKKLCENLFSRITLKKKEKEEFKILLKVMDFSDEQIALIIDKKKK